jgi:hypothetical protein
MTGALILAALSLIPLHRFVQAKAGRPETGAGRNRLRLLWRLRQQNQRPLPTALKQTATIPFKWMKFFLDNRPNSACQLEVFSI